VDTVVEAPRKSQTPNERGREQSAGNSNQRPDVLMVRPYAQWAIDMLAATYQIHRLWEAADPAAFVAERASRIRAIATDAVIGFKADLIDALPNLEVICSNGAGTDSLDLEAAKRRGIPVTNTPGVLAGDVADLAVALAISVIRRMRAADAYIRSGEWARRGTMEFVPRFFGRRVGIAGLGHIGRAVAKRLSGFDAEIGYFDIAPRPDVPYTFFDDLVALATWCNLLIVTLAGGPSTHKIVTASVFEALGPDGYFVNVSRGFIVDEPPLLDALENHRIAGAGLDVFWNEPNIDARFLALDNVVLYPHHGSGTAEARKAMLELVRDNLAAHFSGRPLLTPVV
jgi:lactate dehydrogenase-like 2-hydroxyacid dehydrogenase